MEGIVFKYDIKESIGCILAEDGHFYNFNLMEVSTMEELKGLDSVTFKALKSKREAIAIKKIPEKEIDEHIIPDEVIFDQMHQTHWDVYQYQENDPKRLYIDFNDKKSVSDYYYTINDLKIFIKELKYNAIFNSFVNFIPDYQNNGFSNDDRRKGRCFMGSNYGLIGKKNIFGSTIGFTRNSQERLSFRSGMNCAFLI